MELKLRNTINFELLQTYRKLTCIDVQFDWWNSNYSPVILAKNWQNLQLIATQSIYILICQQMYPESTQENLSQNNVREVFENRKKIPMEINIEKGR